MVMIVVVKVFVLEFSKTGGRYGGGDVRLYMFVWLVVLVVCGVLVLLASVLYVVCVRVLLFLVLLCRRLLMNTVCFFRLLICR